MQPITGVKLRVQGIDKPFDSDLDTIYFVPGPSWGYEYYWWFFAENPHAMEWRCLDKTLQVKIEDNWTDADWLGAGRSTWEAMFSRTSDWWDAKIQITDGKITNAIFAIWDRDSDAAGFVVDQDLYRKVMSETKTGLGVKKMPDFTDEQLEKLRVKIGERYLQAAKMCIVEGHGHFRHEMKYNADRLKEIGFDPPEHDFKPKGPIEVPVFRLPGVDAVFVTPFCDEDGDDYHCECAVHYAHDQEQYEDDNSCACDNCCDNDSHWATNGKNPEHCNFCAEHAEHLKKHCP